MSLVLELILRIVLELVACVMSDLFMRWNKAKR